MFAKAASLLFLAAIIGCSPDESDPTDTGAVQETGSPQETGTDTADAGPEIWTGPAITFTKEDGADHTDPANQDAITDLVVLTRTNQGSLINIVTESSATSSSPSGTQWAEGTTDAMDGLEFENLKAAANNSMSSIPGKSFVLHLVEENIYIDVTFLSWTSGGSAGGFSYERSTRE